MLRQKGATIDQNGDNALLASVESGNRECFAAMIEDQENIILKKIKSHSLSYYAITMKSNLLPLIAAITEKQCKIQKGIMEEDETEFPPNDVNKKNDKKKFQTALDLQDQYLPYEEIKANVKQIKSVFNQISENISEDENLVDQQYNNSYVDNDLNYNYNYLDGNKSKDQQSNNYTNNQQNQKADSSQYLPQIPMNSESTKESNDGGILESNNQKKKHHQKSTKIEEITIDNKKMLGLSQEQLNSKQNIQYTYLSSANEEESQNQIADYYDEEEDEADNNEIEIEEEEVENELGNTQKGNYEYEYEYEEEYEIERVTYTTSPQAAS